MPRLEPILRPRWRQSLPVVLAAALHLGAPVFCPAEPDNIASTNLLPFVPTSLQATVQNGETVGFEQMRRVFLTVQQRRLVFMLPQDYRADFSNPEKIVLCNADFTSLLTIRILTPSEADVALVTAVTADTCRSWLQAQWPDPVILQEHSFSAAGQSGPAFDFVGKVDRVPRHAQIGFVPSPVGLLEFSAVCSPEQFEAAKSTLYILMRGFQISGPDGQLTITAYRGEN